MDASSDNGDTPGLTEHHISQLSSDASSSEGSESGPPELERDEDSSIVFPPFELTKADHERVSRYMPMSARTWMQDSGIQESLSVMGHVVPYTDDFVWHQGMINGRSQQDDAPVVAHLSDKKTVTMETNSVDLEELDKAQNGPRSIYKVTATDPDDFNDEHWGTMEFAT
jgi:hypothetical protein